MGLVARPPGGKEGRAVCASRGCAAAAHHAWNARLPFTPVHCATALRLQKWEAEGLKYPLTGMSSPTPEQVRRGCVAVVADAVGVYWDMPCMPILTS